MIGPLDGMPPFAALRAFHAAARRGRFRDAAKDLNVSESAISHQVRRLEDFLHVRLFERDGPRVSLTAAGSGYFEEIDPAIARIAEASRALMRPAGRARVALTLPPSLAVFWLIPNLAAFEQANPDIDLELVTTTRLVDLRREQIDMALRRGRGPWPDVESEFLLAETAVPVCKPGYLSEDAPGDVAGAVARSRLIINNYFPDEWLEWAQVNGLPAPDAEGALRLESQEQVFAAAETGLGLAIGRSPLVDDRLKSGALIAPFGTPDPSDAGYHLCRRPGTTPTAPGRRVARWLRALAKAEAAS
ncbi:MAG: LysR substrate-binding domain-containing protein [Alphaproteobacteria bacterium]|nr:LysR substrate-binding domain-containing protein [Alphaproteobacteria bacterium]